MRAGGRFWEAFPKDVSAIYVITHVPSGRRYVGITVCIRRRWSQHARALRRGGHYAKVMQEDWSRDGAEAFDFEIIEHVPAQSMMDGLLEWWYISHLNAVYNDPPQKLFTDQAWQQACQHVERFWADLSATKT